MTDHRQPPTQPPSDQFSLERALHELSQRALERHRKALAGVGRTRRLCDYLGATLATLQSNWLLQEPLQEAHLVDSSQLLVPQGAPLHAVYAHLALRALRSPRGLGVAWAGKAGRDAAETQRQVWSLLVYLWVEGSLYSLLPACSQDEAGWAYLVQAVRLAGTTRVEVGLRGASEVESSAELRVASQADLQTQPSTDHVATSASLLAFHALVTEPVGDSVARARASDLACVALVCDGVEAWQEQAPALTALAASQEVWRGSGRVVPLVLCEPDELDEARRQVEAAGWQTLGVEPGFGVEARLYAALEWLTDDALSTLNPDGATEVPPLDQPTALVLAQPKTLGIPPNTLEALTEAQSNPQARARLLPLVEAWLRSYHVEKLLNEAAVPSTWHRDTEYEVGRAERLQRPLGRSLGQGVLSALAPSV